MDTSSPPDPVSDLEAADLSLGPKIWDRRRPDALADWATACLEHAANYLIEDQMQPDRMYWPGAIDAVRLLRKAVLAVKADALLHQRVSRAAAAWLPKSAMARQVRDDASDA
jgi:hypothetical protein